MAGHTLNITKVNRVHMGTYRCIADNGIPPIANQTFQVDVYCEYGMWNGNSVIKTRMRKIRLSPFP